MLFSNDRRALRNVFVSAWRKRCQDQPLEPLERLIADVIARHPQYHSLLEQPEAAQLDYPDSQTGETNPFLHMALLITLAEQLGADQPPGIRRGYQRVLTRFTDPHDAEHAIIGLLGPLLHTAAQRRTTPDPGEYLAGIERLGAIR